MYTYRIGHDKLEHVREMKDIGITIVSSLSWKCHINNIVSKANRMLRLVKRTVGLALKLLS